jgi:hypothetical protein
MKFILTLLVLSFISTFSRAALSIEGSYQGKNLYVQNPMDDDGLGIALLK